MLFQIKPAKHKSLQPNLVLCIPESYIPHIIYLYHDNILGGHQGVDRMYWTIKEKFYFPNRLPCYTNMYYAVKLVKNPSEFQATVKNEYGCETLDAKQIWLQSHFTLYM